MISIHMARGRTSGRDGDGTLSVQGYPQVGFSTFPYLHFTMRIQTKYKLRKLVLKCVKYKITRLRTINVVL